MPRFLILVLLLFFAAGCSKTSETTVKPLLVLKTGTFTINGSEVPVGGKLSFGITATGGSAPLTNLIIRRQLQDDTITELDKGFYIKEGGLDIIFNAVKSAREREVWSFTVMNANRDTVSRTLEVLLGEGSAYGEILHFPEINLGMQHHQQLPQYLDLHTGTSYTAAEVAGHEAEIDLVAFVYYTSGVMSPTLCCPAYSGSSSVTGHYPAIGDWTVRNATTFDYYTSDNQLISPETFEAAINDSLLVNTYKPGNVSGLCKFAYSGRVVPFRTEDGKYGLINIKHADEVSDGTISLQIKIQQ